MSEPDNVSRDVDLRERRRVTYEQFLWQVPSASFAGQAFLLTTVLRPDTSPVGRLVASLFGLAAAVGVLVAYVKHRYSEEVYAEWINAFELSRGGRKLVQAEVKREAYLDRPDERFSWDARRLRRLTRLSAFEVWAMILGLFVVGDLSLTVLAVVEASGGGSLLR